MLNSSKKEGGRMKAKKQKEILTKKYTKKKLKMKIKFGTSDSPVKTSSPKFNKVKKKILPPKSKTGKSIVRKRNKRGYMQQSSGTEVFKPFMM